MARITLLLSKIFSFSGCLLNIRRMLWELLGRQRGDSKLHRLPARKFCGDYVFNACFKIAKTKPNLLTRPRVLYILCLLILHWPTIHFYFHLRFRRESSIQHFDHHTIARKALSQSIRCRFNLDAVRRSTFDVNITHNSPICPHLHITARKIYDYCRRANEISSYQSGRSFRSR